MLKAIRTIRFSVASLLIERCVNGFLPGEKTQCLRWRSGQPGRWKTAVKLGLHYGVDIPLCLNTAMIKAVESRGKVVRVELIPNGRPVRIQARKSVIFAADGFEYTQKMHDQ